MRRVRSRIAVVGLLTLTLGALGFRGAGEAPPSSRVFVSSTSSGTVGGVAFADEDIVVFDEMAETWSLHMDGSAVGLPGSAKLDGFHVMGDDTVLFSLSAPANLPDLGVVDDSDVIELDPAAGTLSLFFDGSVYGLSSAGEDVDAVGLDPAGQLVVSTVGSGSTGAGTFADEDLLRLVDGSLELFFDGSAVALSSSAEDVVAASVDPDGGIRLSTLGNFSVVGLSGTRSDVARCEPTTSGPVTSCAWTARWSGADFGFQTESLNGLTIQGSPLSPPTTTTTTTLDTTTTTSDGSTTSSNATTTAPTTTAPSTTTTAPTTTAPTTTTTAPTTTTTAPQPEITEGNLFLVSTSGGTVGGVSFTDEDVVTVNEAGQWSLFLDGSDLGINASLKLDGVAVKSDTTVLFSLSAPATLPGVGAVDDSDVVALNPSSLGPVTAGSLSLYFDGSDHGLSSSGENVDAVGLDRNGNLLLSTKGAASGPFGRSADEDVLVFDGTSLSLFLDGSAVGLSSAPENVVGISVHESGAVQLSTLGNHSVAGASGDRSDVLQCMPTDSAPITDCYWLSSFDGGAAGYGSETIGAMSATSMVGFYTDFDAPLESNWDIYYSPGHAGWGLRRPSAVAVGPDPQAGTGGLLTITAKMGTGDETGQLVSGGVKVHHPQIYGNYLVRVKVEPDPDGVTSGAVLLWPESNQHPRDGEIDILESWSNRETRTPVESNLHWLRPGAEPPFTAADDYKAQVVHPGVDGTEWHVFELEWREDLVSVAVDGGTPVVLSTNPAEIASWNMEPTIQLDAFDAFDAPGVQPSLTGEVVMSVDYLIVRP